MPLTLLHPAALWLILPGFALIVYFRLLRNQRQTLEVGSLLIWRKLAALSAPPQKRKLVLDASLFLQALALITVIAALAAPQVLPVANHGRSILLVIDNGPLSRARSVDGSPYFKELFASARSMLLKLQPNDRVVVARSAPFPKLLDPAPMSGNDAAAMMANRERSFAPALSGPDVSTIRAFALDRARTIFPDGSARTVVLSMQADSEPNPESSPSLSWMRSVSPNANFDNAGIVACGSTTTQSNARQILVRVGNYSDKELRGTLIASVDASGNPALGSKPIKVAGRNETVVVFDVPQKIKQPIFVRLSPEAGFVDALPEDNAVRFDPRAEHPLLVRFHSPLPILEQFFQSALQAQTVNAFEPDSADTKPADLDVFVGSVPDDLSAQTRAALFVAPSKGYHSYFDTSDKTMTWPKVRRGEDDPLNADIPASDAAIAIPKAFEILRTGDFKTLLQDADSQRALALRFSDERARPCLVLAFVPNDTLAAERRLDPPLAALLARFALQANASGDPYSVAKAADEEARTGEPLPLSITPTSPGNDIVFGVLNERASNLLAAAKSADSGKPNDAVALFAPQPGSQSASIAELLPWLALLGFALVLLEQFLSLKSSLKRG